MTINLATKYSASIADKFTKESFISGNVSTEYDWQGVKSVSVYTPQTVGLNDYTRSGANRFGTPVEMEDSLQVMTLSQDKGFAITIDKGNNADQMLVKNAGRMMNIQVAEQVVPFMDRYSLGRFVAEAGKIDGLAAAPTKANIVEKIFDGAKVLDNALVPADNRVLYLPAGYYNLLRLSAEFLAVDTLAQKSLEKGVVGMIADMKCVKVPDSYFAADVYFLITYKRSVVAPNKLKTARILTDVQGIDGAVLEGRNYFDAFVLGAKADGVYAAVAAASVLAAPTIGISNSLATITPGSGNTAKYTLDGSDPRYSKAAEVYSAPVAISAGQTLKAYVYKIGKYNSPVASATA